MLPTRPFLLCALLTACAGVPGELPSPAGGGGGTSAAAGGGTAGGGAAGGTAGGATAGGAAGGTMSSCAGRTGAPGDFTRTLTHASGQRSYRLHAPSSYTGQPMALVLVLHGYTETAQLIELQSGFDALSGPRGYLVAYPQGLSNSWNAGGTCCGSSATDKVDDVGFLRQLIATISAEYCVDPKRVHVTGMSNGGFMTHRVGCELSDVVASVASCAGQLQQSPCTPGRKVPVVQMHGTSDPIVPYTGLWYPSTEASMRSWAMRNGCTSLTPMRTSSNSLVDVDEWPCPAQGRVVLHTVKGGGHTWFQPAAENPGATRVFADFFDANPMP